MLSHRKNYLVKSGASNTISCTEFLVVYSLDSWLKLNTEMETKRVRSEGDAGRCTKQRTKQRYSKKRRSHYEKKTVQSHNIDAQQESSIPVAVETLQEFDFETTTTTASTSKIIDIDSVQTESNPDLLTGYRLVDVELLYDIFNSLACPACYGVETLQLYDIDVRKKGLARLCILKCIYCPFEKQAVENVKKEGGKKFMEVNVRMA